MSTSELWRMAVAKMDEMARGYAESKWALVREQYSLQAALVNYQCVDAESDPLDRDIEPLSREHEAFVDVVAFVLASAMKSSNGRVAMEQDQALVLIRRLFARYADVSRDGMNFQLSSDMMYRINLAIRSLVGGGDHPELVRRLGAINPFGASQSNPDELEQILWNVSHLLEQNAEAIFSSDLRVASKYLTAKSVIADALPYVAYLFRMWEEAKRAEAS